MRQYRGRIKDSTVWVYGYYTKSPQGIARIWSPITKDNGESYLYDYVVDPETVGQSTGLKDKNGKEIYEGDIISTDLDRPFNIVVFRNGAFMFQCHDNGKDYYDYMFSVDEESDQWKFGEVIGNIYENPELLKGAEA